MVHESLVGFSKEDYEALASYRSAIRRAVRESEEAARSVGLTPQQHQLLLAVKGQIGRDWACIGDLAESLQIRHHAAVGLVDRCEVAGLVCRARGVRDRRQVRVLLTPKGETVLDRLARHSQSELDRLRTGLTVAA